MVAEEFLSKIASWVPDYDEINKISSQKYDVPELYSEPILLSEAILTKIFSGDSRIENHFARLMITEPTDIYDMIFRSWTLRYFNKRWENEYKKKIDRKIEKYISKNGVPGKFSKLEALYVMYLSFALEKKFKIEIDVPREPSFIANYLIAKLNAQGTLDKKALEALKKFQNKNGGFPSSSLTTKKPNIYGTALALIPLIVDNYKSERVRKALNFIFSYEPPYGHVKGEDPQLYINLLVSYAIRLYKFFEESHKDPIVKLASKNKELNLILYSQFNDYLSKSFELIRTERIIREAFGTKLIVKERRKDIYEILFEKGGIDPARIIDELKVRYPQKYKVIKKRSHLTMIKLDLEFMRHLGLLSETNSKYFII